MSLSRIFCAASLLLIVLAISNTAVAEEFTTEPVVAAGDDYQTPGSATSTVMGYSPPDGAYLDQPMDVFGPQLRARIDVGNGFYEDSFYTLGVMVPFHIEPLVNLWFLEVRGYVTEHSRFGGNIGVGYRWYDAPNDRVNGISVWYDDDNTNTHQYQQIGLSLETLSYDCDARLNLYYPFDNDANMLWQTPVMDPFFSGNNIFFRQNTRYEIPFKGGDAEVGVPVPFLSEDWNTKIFAGAYYFAGDQAKDAIGPKIRLQAEITPEIWAQVQYTYDRVFGSLGTFAVAIDLPGGPKDDFQYQQPMQHKLAAQVQRDYRVHVTRKTDRQGLIAINPDDMEPFEVVHVDNTNSGGDGTYEDPLSTLPAATDPDTDIVFVRRGDGTTAGGGITLSDNQRLLSESIEHEFEAVRGRYILPGYNPGPLPILSSMSSPIVTLGNNTEVTGFFMEAPNTTVDAIVGTGIDNASILSNEITRTNNAILLSEVTGRINVVDNLITENAQNGISLVNSVSDNVTLTGINNTITDNSADAVNIAASSNARVNVSLQGGTYSQNRFNGIDVASTGNSSVRFMLARDGGVNPTVSGNRFDGLEFTANDTSSLWSSINNTTSSGNGIFGLYFRTADSSITSLNQSGNSISGNGSGNIVIVP